MEYIDLDDQLPLTTSENRSEGLHVSDIYTDIESILFPKKTTADLTNNLWAELGFMFERVLEAKLRIPRPQETQIDGVYCSPDGFEYGILHEYKVVWKSIKVHPSEVWRWMTQAKAYCKAMGTTLYMFHVLYVNGDYKGSGPIYKPVIFSFTEEEIEDNWKMLITHAKGKGWL